LSSAALARYKQRPSPVFIPPNSIGLTSLHSFLSAAECEQLIELGQCGFSRSIAGGRIKPVRTSYSAIPSASHPTVQAVRARVAELIGARDAQIERLAVVRYEPGQQYKPHYDSSSALASPRSHTIFAYLNDVEGGGGETEFTKLGVKFKPKRGDALFWQNQADRESHHKDGKHAGRPPVSGVKYGQSLAGVCLIALLLVAAASPSAAWQMAACGAVLTLM
jgi:prolyl 4-hydroxylase